MDTDLQAALWTAIKTARDEAVNDLARGLLRVAELDALLSRMKAEGMASHLPTIDDV